MITQRTRQVYRHWLDSHGAANLPDEAVDEYIRKMRLRLLIFLPIFAGILGCAIYIMARSAFRHR